MSYTVNHDSKEEGQTRIETICWSFLNFINILEKKCYKEIRMDNHKDLKQLQTNFKLKILFFGINNDVIEIYYSFPKSIFVKSTLKIRLKGFTERTLVTEEYHKIQSNKWQYLATLFKRDIISYETRNTFLLENGSLKLQFIFYINNDIILAPANVSERKLSNDFQNLLDSGLFSDVIIKSAEGIEFKVHKVVLASRSAVLKAHFEHNTLECHTNIIESALETEILNEVLVFIYSDKSPRVDDIPEKLLAAADFYQLDTLKSLCEQALQEKLSVDNVVEILELAELHSAKMLKTMTLQFIKDGHAKHITKTEGWAKVKSIELIKSIYEYIMDVNDGAE